MALPSRRTLLWAVIFVIFVTRVLPKLRRLRERFQAASARLARLPKPRQDEEGYLLGHIASPLLVKPGEMFSPETMVEKMVERLLELSVRFRGQGLMCLRSLSTWTGVPLSLIVPVDIEFVRDLLSLRENIIKGIPYDISDPLIGNSVLHVSGAKHLEQRPQLERGLTTEIVESAMAQAILTVNELADKWESHVKQSGKHQCVEDIRVDMLKLTMDVIGRAAFSFDFHSTTSETAPLYEPFQVILYTLERRGHLIHEHFMRNFPTQRNLEFNKAIGKLDECVQNILKSRVAEAARPSLPPPPQQQQQQQQQQTTATATTRRRDTLDVLLASGLPHDIISDNIKTLLFAGHDTTGAALAWTLYLLAHHPEHMETCRGEIQTKIGASTDPTYEQLDECDFVNACLMETLRLYPSAGFTRRIVKDSVAVAGYEVPEFCEILVLPYILHRDERYWERPNEFLPSRFVDLAKEPGNKAANGLQSRIGRISRDYAYFPFSLGHRNCVGRPLALMEMRVVLIKLLQRFKFAPFDEDPDFAPVPLLTLTLNPKSIKLIPIPAPIQ